jgi:hypothetical protein
MKKKRIVLIATSVITVLVICVLSYLIGTGFHKRTDVILIDYSVSADGTKLTFTTAIPTSMGYIRGFTNRGGGVKPHYLTFYSTFGGLNSSFGAKHEFELDLGKDDTEIYFNRPGGGYELVLQKNETTGKWERP